MFPAGRGASVSHRFFVPPAAIRGHWAVLEDPEDLHHLLRVLRLAPGQRVVFCDGQGTDYQVELAAVTPARAEGRVLSAAPSAAEPPVEVVLLQGLPKGDKMDWIVQKATEVGVGAIVPVLTERTVVSLSPDKARERQARWQRIAREAAKQSQRGRIPAVALPRPWPEAVSEWAKAPMLVLWEGASPGTLRSGLQALAMAVGSQRRVVVGIGPEGGFTVSEVRLAQGAGAVIASLGPRILRTETAGLVALTAILYELGDLA